MNYIYTPFFNGIRTIALLFTNNKPDILIPQLGYIYSQVFNVTDCCEILKQQVKY